MSIALINEYAMMNGWDLNVFPKNTWSAAQNQRFVEWAKFAGKVDSNYSNTTEFAGTTYEPPPPPEMTFQPGQNRVITTTDPAGFRRRSNSFYVDEDLPPDQLLARMRNTMQAQAQTPPDEAEEEWEGGKDQEPAEQGLDEPPEEPFFDEPIPEESMKPITEEPDVFCSVAPLE